MKLIEFSKTECGVDFLMKVGPKKDLKGNISDLSPFKFDFFEIFFFLKGNGRILLGDRTIPIHDNMILFISPFQRQKWEVDEDALDFKFVIFQEEFISNLISDKYFVYRLLYCYQTVCPPSLEIDADEMSWYADYIEEMAYEQVHPVADSYHMLLSSLYSLLIKLNRVYAKEYTLPFCAPKNNYAYKFRQLLEKHIADNLTVNDYAEMTGVSRICLNKNVKEQFGTTVSDMIRSRMVEEIKSRLLFSGLSVKEVAFSLHFSEPNHMMRFFKSQTGQTVCEFVSGYQNGSIP